MTLLKKITGEYNLKELHEFKNNYKDGFKTFIRTGKFIVLLGYSTSSWYTLL